MDTIPLHVEWLKKMLPEGYPIQGSTLISGPGGSGKPLIGNVIAASWLQNGGAVAFLTLQYPDRSFLYRSFKGAAEDSLEKYHSRIQFVQLDTEAEKMEATDELGIKANLVKPEQWRDSMDHIAGTLPQDGPGILIFAAALNLLMFSPTYGTAIVDEMQATMRDSRFAALFSASTKPMAEQVQKLEAAADNLIMSHKAENAFELYMQIERMKDAPFNAEEIRIPIPESELSSMKEVAEHSRKRIIPQISQM